MYIKLTKRPWYIRHKYYIALGAVLLAFLIYNVITFFGPTTVHTDADDVKIGEVKNDDFREYVDVEGLVQPIMTIKVNSRENGSVARIVAEEGTMLNIGDTILVIDNPDLQRTIEEERLAWEKQQINHRLQQYQMEQKSLSLRQQSLQAEYDMERLSKSYTLDKEEAQMGIKSKAQLEVAEDEYEYNIKKTRLTLESLRHDSAVNVIQRTLLDNELESSRNRYQRTLQRQSDLVVTAPVSGQLSFVNATIGQRIGAGEAIADIKVLDSYKIQVSLSEYYIDRITTGLPASVTYQGKEYPLRISRVVPEVKDRTFTAELTFTADMPDNARVGKSYRIQIELGKPEKAIVIPRGDFYNVTGGRWIYRLNESGDKAVRVPITIGRQNPQQYEVLEGLLPGDRILISGYEKFGDAEQVKIN
ncbi:MAG: HlyD family efflux transporter periplasmic adaptor subunit [Bacteroidaceae bacterium]|nr:HlyD family efflux transporter periplasmic adaptor subunit [Bacteroidaceae bacterium]